MCQRRCTITLERDPDTPWIINSYYFTEEQLAQVDELGLVLGSQLDLRLVRNGVVYCLPLEYWEFNVRTMLPFRLKRPMVVVDGVLYDRAGTALLGCSDRKTLKSARSTRTLRECCLKSARSLKRVVLNEGLTRVCKNALAVQNIRTLELPETVRTLECAAIAFSDLENADLGAPAELGDCAVFNC